MKRFMWHIGIRIYIYLYMPIISFVMNRWYSRRYSSSVNYAQSKVWNFTQFKEVGNAYVNTNCSYIPDRFDWQSSPTVFLLRGGGDCEDWAAWWRAIYPGGRIYRMYNIELKRGHAVYVVDGTMYDQKTEVELPKTTDWTIEEKLLVYFNGRYTEVI